MKWKKDKNNEKERKEKKKFIKSVAENGEKGSLFYFSQQSRMNNLSDIYARFLLLGIVVEKADMHEKWKKLPKATSIQKKLQYERKRVLCELCVHMCVCVSASKREGGVSKCIVCEWILLCVGVHMWACV